MSKDDEWVKKREEAAKASSLLLCECRGLLFEIDGKLICGDCRKETGCKKS